MEDSADDSRLEQELEALSAIYINELTFNRDEMGQVKEISLLLHPATANDTSKQFVCMNLVFHPTSQYPDEAPDISIRNPRGLGQEEVSSLVEDMKANAESSLGEVMLYTLIEMAKDSLTEGNIPHCPCIVCLEHFDESSNFHRTACYHYFHNHCLHKYLKHVRAQIAEEEAENAKGNLHHLQASKNVKTIICPMCRCDLEGETLAVRSVESDENDEGGDVFVPSLALREQQKEMAERFERQKALGGIIDLEWEKNKYLVNPEDNASQRASETLCEPNGDNKVSPEPSQANFVDERRGPTSQGAHNYGDQREEKRETYRKRDDRSRDSAPQHFRERHKTAPRGRGNYSHRGPRKGQAGQRYEDRDHQSFRSHYRDDKRGGRGREHGRGQGYESSWVDYRTDESSRHQSRYESNFRAKGGRCSNGRGSYNPRHQNMSNYNNQDDYGFHGNKYDRRREQERAQANFSPNARPLYPKGDRSADADEAVGVDAESKEQDDINADMRNFYINQKWRDTNSVTRNIDKDARQKPRKFGAVHDDFDCDLEKENHAFSNGRDLHANPHHTRVNGHSESERSYPGFNDQADELEENVQSERPYPGFNHSAYEEEDNWEDEIDPYATEVTKFKGDGLKKYFDYQKTQTKQYEDKLAQRVEQEKAVSAEMRRIHKEKGRKQSYMSRAALEGENADDSYRSGKSYRGTYKREAGNPTAGHEEDPGSMKHRDQYHGKANKGVFQTRCQDTTENGSKSGKMAAPAQESMDVKPSDQKRRGGKQSTGDSNVSLSDIRWFGSKPVQDFYHPRSSEDQEIEVDLINNGVYEDAWERRAQLDRKSGRNSNQRVRSNNKREDGYERKYQRERNNGRGIQREKSSKSAKASSDHWEEADRSRCSQASKEGDSTYNSEEASWRMDGQSVMTTNNFRKPRPLDMRKANGHASQTEGDDAYLNKRCDNKNTKAPSKSQFKKPKPLDFRKSSSNPQTSSFKLPQEPGKDTPS